MNIIKKLLFKNTVYNFSKIAASINLKPIELDLKETDKCLCLAPHADDESIGMGGVLSLYPKNFDVILLTDGKKGIKDLGTDEVTKIREEEFKSAMQVAGIENFSCLRAPDKKLLNSYNLFITIDISKYNYIFIPNIIDQHPDHKAVGILLKQLIKNGTKIKPGLKICFYEVWSALGLVNAYVNISDVLGNKKNMINCYKSQTAQKDYEYHALGLNQYRGMLKDKKYVEAFCILELSDFEKVCNLY